MQAEAATHPRVSPLHVLPPSGFKIFIKSILLNLNLLARFVLASLINLLLLLPTRLCHLTEFFPSRDKN